MKKLTTVLLSAVLLLMAAACQKPQEEQEIPVTYISLDKTSASLLVGETLNLTATVLPENASDKSVKWSSSATAVATVADGVVTAVSEGFATITVSAGSKLATCAVTVKKESKEVTSITLDVKSVALLIGETVTVSATVLPEDATDKTVTWSSGDPSVAKVEDGVITAVSEGVTAITATAGAKTAVCAVIVSENIIPVASVSLNKTSLALIEGETETLTATVLPADATDKTLTWTSSNPAVATVEDGVVSAVSEGVAAISAQAGGKSSSCAVVVSKRFIPVASITLDKTSIAMVEGETQSISATVLPADATDKTVTWTSSNPAVAIAAGGIVAALSEGSATITATAGEKTATCQITVSKRYISVESVTLNKKSLALIEGGSETLIATVHPADATEQDVSWISSNTAVATVEAGVVTAVAEGTATITASAGGKSAVCAVVVSKEIIEVESITLDKTSFVMVEGDIEAITATVLPDNATDKTVTWISSNTSVATVEDGIVMAISEGTATITAIAGDVSATCQVTVEKKIIPVESVTLDKSSLEMVEGDTQSLTATVLPADATDKTVTWTSSNTSVATVSDGLVTAIAEGSATITATAGGFSATCQVIVEKKIIPVTSITLDQSSLDMVEGEVKTLTATVLPADATDKTVTWTSSNPSVATVSDGVVTALAMGETTITATAGGLSATCHVTVSDATVAVTGVSLDKVSVELTKGQQVTLVATVQPGDASNKSVTWTSSAASVASVSADGVVTALAVGTAVIKVRTNDGGYEATCTVTVVNSSTGATLEDMNVEEDLFDSENI